MSVPTRKNSGLSPGGVLIIVLLLLFVVGPAASCIACTFCAAAVSSQTPATPLPPPGGPPAAALSKETPSAPAASGPAPLPLRQRDFDHYLGEAFRLGDFSYRVTKVETRYEVGNRFTRQEAPRGAIYVLVHFSETNEGRQTATVMMGGNGELIDEGGRAFRTSSNAQTALAMSGRQDYLASELNPGVQRDAVMAFELPREAAEGRLILKMQERGLLGTGQKRVLLRTADSVAVINAIEEVVLPVIPLLRKSDAAGIRAKMLPEDAAKLPDAELTKIMEDYNTAVDNSGNRRLTIEGGGRTNVPNGSVVTPDYVTVELRFLRERGRWRERDGKIVFKARNRGGRYYFVRTDVFQPAGRGKRSRR